MATARTRTSPTGEQTPAAAGFTLFELLIVLLLLAIMAGFAASRITGSFDGPTLQATSAEVAAVLRRARSESIVENRPVAVRFDVDAPAFGIPGERVHKVSERLRLSLFTAVTEQLAVNVGEIQFFPDGSSTGGEVTLAGEKARHFVQVDWLTGRVAIYEE